MSEVTDKELLEKAARVASAAGLVGRPGGLRIIGSQSMPERWPETTSKGQPHQYAGQPAMVLWRGALIMSHQNARKLMAAARAMEAAQEAVA